MTLTDSGDENVVEAVVVIVAHCRAESEERNAEAGFTSHICECAIVIIVKELRRGGAVFLMAGPVLSVDDEDVGIAVVVVVDERAAGAHCLRQPFFSERAVVVGV